MKIRKIKDWLKKTFSAKFVHPIVIQKLDTALDDKIKRRAKDQDKEIEKQDEILAQYLKSYFGKQYKDQAEMSFAFGVVNKQWEKHCRNVNGTSRLIRLNKNAFKSKVKLVINNINEKKTQAQ